MKTTAETNGRTGDRSSARRQPEAALDASPSGSRELAHRIRRSSSSSPSGRTSATSARRSRSPTSSPRSTAACSTTATPDDPERDRFVLSKGQPRSRSTRRSQLRGWLRRDAARRPTAATAAARRRTRSTRCRDRLLDRLARPGPLDRRGRRARGPAAGLDAARLRAAQRRRVQRGLGLGGGHVRRPPPARRTWSPSST